MWRIDDLLEADANVWPFREWNVEFVSKSVFFDCHSSLIDPTVRIEQLGV